MSVSEKTLSALEVPALLAVPSVMVACVLLGVPATAGLTLLVACLSVLLMLASYEASRPLMRQLMPTVVLAAIAVAGRMAFSPFADVKPVSAICIVAGASLGRRSGFATGALAALKLLLWPGSLDAMADVCLGAGGLSGGHACRSRPA